MVFKVRFLWRPGCLPSCVAHVSVDITRKINSFEYVDLASVLPSRVVSSEPPAKRIRLDESADSAVCISTVSTPRRKIETLADWTEAWLMFSIIACDGAPGPCGDLLEHQLRIIQAAQKYRFASVRQLRHSSGGRRRETRWRVPIARWQCSPWRSTPLPWRYVSQRPNCRNAAPVC